MSHKWRTLWSLALAELLAMSLWFSATAVAPSLQVEWNLTVGQTAWLTMTVQLGFVIGALSFAIGNIADIFPPKRVFAAGAFAGGVFTAAIPALSIGFEGTLVLRLLTGVCLAAVYPVGMKIMATWTKEDRGLGIGLLVGALAAGSALPHLIRAMGGFGEYQLVLYGAAGLSFVAGFIVVVLGDQGPYRAAAATFQWTYLTRALTERPLRLANSGYLGHMWELYAMWAWLPMFLSAAYSAGYQGASAERIATHTALVSFVVIAVGGLGSLLAGWLADRVGRTTVTIASMALSGSAAVAIGLAWHSPVAVTVIALIWGVTIIADSAQFSTAVSELGEPEYMGTLLTTQTCVGFLLTLVSIQLTPVFANVVGWRYAFIPLALGPLWGCLAMWKLRQLPVAAKLANGNR